MKGTVHPNEGKQVGGLVGGLRGTSRVAHLLAHLLAHWGGSGGTHLGGLGGERQHTQSNSVCLVRAARSRTAPRGSPRPLASSAGY